MIRLEMKNHNLILTERQKKYQHYHLEKLINMNILQMKKYYQLIKEDRQNKLRLHVFLQEKLETKKRKQLRVDAKSN